MRHHTREQRLAVDYFDVLSHVLNHGILCHVALHETLNVETFVERGDEISEFFEIGVAQNVVQVDVRVMDELEYMQPHIPTKKTQKHMR